MLKIDDILDHIVAIKLAGGTTLVASVVGRRLWKIYLKRQSRKRVIFAAGPFAESPFCGAVVSHVTAELGVREFDPIVRILSGRSPGLQQIEQLDKLRDDRRRSAAAIVLANLVDPDRKALERIVREVGRPVVFLDEDPFAGSSVYPTCCGFVGTDNRLGGKLAAEALFSAMPRKNTYRVLVIGSSRQPERQRAFCDRLRQLAPSIEITVDEQGAFDCVAAKRRVGMYLDRSKTHRCDGIFATNDPMAIGAAEVVTARNASSAVKVVGFDGIPDVIRMIDEGRSPLVCTVVQDIPALVRHAFIILESLMGGTCVEPVRLVEPRLYGSHPGIGSFAA